jgi:hypothetical protein
MDYKQACSAIVSICREQSNSDAGHREFWLREMERWLVRSGEKSDVAVTHEVHDGRMVPKPSDGKKP